MVKYISDGTWFDKDTECKLITDCSSGDYKAGIFSGVRTSELRGECHPKGEKYEDEEYCSFDEFKIIDG